MLRTVQSRNKDNIINNQETRNSSGPVTFMPAANVSACHSETRQITRVTVTCLFHMLGNRDPVVVISTIPLQRKLNRI